MSIVHTPGAEIAVHRRTRQRVWLDPEQPVWRFNSRIDQQVNHATGREMAPLQIRRSQLHRGDDLTEMLYFLARQLARNTPVPAMKRARPELFAQRPVDCVSRDAV